MSTLLLGCSEPGQGRTRPSLLPGLASAPRSEGDAASWVFHPSSGAETKARLRLGEGRVLGVGEGGERWITGEGHTARAAAVAAPEALFDVGKQGGSYVFVGASGSVYIADEPLGPFVAVRQAPEQFLSVGAGGGAVAGVTKDGIVWSGSEWGSRWRRASTPEGHVIAVALGQRGQGLALVVPEQWWLTDDHGRSFRPIDLPSIGARSLVRASSGELLVDGLYGQVRFEEGRWVPQPRARTATQPLVTELGPAPDAARVMERTAVLDGSEYLALELRGADRERHWYALSGPLGSRLTERRVAGLSAATCGEVVLAKRGADVAVLCGTSHSGQASTGLSLWMSRDGGNQFRRLKPKLRGVWGELRLAVGEQGTVALSGVCPPHLTASGCAPRGAYRLRQGGDTLEPLGLPGLNAPDALAFGAGGSLYVVGAREKDGRLTLYVSLDGGSSFRARDLEITDGKPERRSTARAEPTQMALDPGGAISVTVQGGGRWRLVVLDSEGHVLARGEAPSAAKSVAAVGLKALAVDPSSRSLWESVDGGNSWELTPLPRPLCRFLPRVPGGTDVECKVPLACSFRGCVFGDSLSRLGWGSAREDGILATVDRVESGVPSDHSYKTPVACVLGNEPWQIIEGLNRAPAAPAAAIGRTHWFAMAADYETGAVWAVHAYQNKRAFERHELFGPLAEPAHHALAVLDQVEGGAALRYRVPLSSRNEKELSGIEVAWDNRFEDVLGRARIAERVRPHGGDYQNRAPRTLLAEPALLSVAGKGVFLRLHPSLDDRQVTYFADGRTVERLPEIIWPKSDTAKRTEMIRVGARPVPLAIYDGGTQIAWATPSDTSQDGTPNIGFQASTLAPPDQLAQGLAQAVNIAYTGKVPGFSVMQAALSGTWWRAYAVPFQETGLRQAATGVPLQPDLSDPPAPCDESSRNSSPRIVAPSFPGRPHPVLISDPTAAPRLLFTDRAVVHGTPEQPCVAAFDASMPQRTDVRSTNSVLGTLMPSGAGERWFAILPTMDLSHAWAFQEISESRWQRRILARPMSCRFEPGLTIPPDLMSQSE